MALKIVVAVAFFLLLKETICSDCVIGKHYCGRDLDSTWNIPVQRHDWHYTCTSPSSAEYSKCAGQGCVSGTKAYCKCQPGRRYCGDEILMAGWTRVFPAKNVYVCNSKGDNLDLIRTCLGTCDRGLCTQDCEIDKSYCGPQLERLEGWELAVNHPDYWYKCVSFNFVHQYRCENGCAPGRFPYCKCRPQKHYCGYELNDYLRGWSGYDINTLYYCNERPTPSNQLDSVTLVRKCKDICINGHCSQTCQVGKEYCGHQLKSEEGWDIAMDRLNFLYKCTEGGTSTSVISSCSLRCIGNGNEKAHCSCAPSSILCGAELEALGYIGLNHNATYNCSMNGTAIERTKCDGKCISATPRSFCPANCNEGGLYCGNEFGSGYEHLNRHELYHCIEGRPESYKVCSRVCAGRSGKSRCQGECRIGRLYCGYELEALSFEVDSPQHVYLCTGQTSIQLNDTCAIKCMNDVYARCNAQCTPGLMYCGHELKQIGFRSGTNKALYICNQPTIFSQLQVCNGTCVVSMQNSTCGPADYPKHFSECGTLNSDSQLPYIRGGQTSSREAWPWMVSLKLDGRSHHCGGVLIDEQWVLTAAHCVKPYFETLKHVIVGEWRLWQYDRGQVNVSIASIHRHSKYKDQSMDSDIALIQLNQSVHFGRFVRPICLPGNKTDPKPGTKCAAAGWGFMQNFASPNALQVGYLEVLNDHICKKTFRRAPDADYTFNSNTMICAGQGDEMEDALPCQGDSGGPLMCQNIDGSWSIEGIVSFGAKDACNSTVPLYSAFTKVSPFVPWIQETIRRKSKVTSYVVSSDDEYFAASASALVATMYDGSQEHQKTADVEIMYRLDWQARNNLTDEADEELHAIEIEPTGDDSDTPLLPDAEGDAAVTNENDARNNIHHTEPITQQSVDEVIEIVEYNNDEQDGDVPLIPTVDYTY